jgi:hypothetical protein
MTDKTTPLVYDPITGTLVETHAFDPNTPLRTLDDVINAFARELKAQLSFQYRAFRVVDSDNRMTTIHLGKWNPHTQCFTPIGALVLSESGLRVLVDQLKARLHKLEVDDPLQQVITTLRSDHDQTL